MGDDRKTREVQICIKTLTAIKRQKFNSKNCKD